MLGYLSLNIICPSKLGVFFELRSRKTVLFSEQIMSADKYACIFSRQMAAIVYIGPEITCFYAQSEPISVQFAGALEFSCLFKRRIQLHNRVYHLTAFNGMDLIAPDKYKTGSTFQSITFDRFYVGKFLKKLWCCVGGSITR